MREISAVWIASTFSSKWFLCDIKEQRKRKQILWEGCLCILYLALFWGLALPCDSILKKQKKSWNHPVDCNLLFITSSTPRHWLLLGIFLLSHERNDPYLSKWFWHQDSGYDILKISWCQTQSTSHDKSHPSPHWCHVWRISTLQVTFLSSLYAYLHTPVFHQLL